MPRGAAKQSSAFQVEYHLMNGWCGDCEEALHVGLRRRASIDLRVGMNEHPRRFAPTGDHFDRIR